MDDKNFFRASKARTERGYATFDIALDTAINDQVINMPGTLFFLDKSSTGICTVEGNVGQGTSRNPLLASPGFSMFNEEGFADFRISAPAQAGKVLKIVVATGMSIKPGDAIQSGAVGTATVDGGLARTVANQAFLLTLGQGAVALNNLHAQLWNAATNTKSLILESLSFSSSTAQSIIIGQLNAALTTGGAQGWSKNLYGAAGLGQVRSQANVGLLIAAMLSFQVTANLPFVVNLREPIVIRPGYGLVVGAATINTDLGVNFEWFEQ